MVEVLTWAGLVARAGSEARARTLLRQGWWRPVLHDAYVAAAEEDTPEVRLAALRRVLPPGTALSHRSALWLLGRDVLGPHLDVTVARGRHLQARPGLRVHTAALPHDELVEVGGVLAVSAARAVVDVARNEPLAEAVAFGDEALRSGHAVLHDVRAVLEDSGRLRGVVRARAAVELLDGRSESPMESRLRVSLHVGGLRGLLVQHDVYDDDGHVGRSDLAVEGVLLEYDGREARLDPEVFVRERQRQNRFLELGLDLRRYTARDVYGVPSRRLALEVERAVLAGAHRDRSAVRRGPDTLRPPAARPLPTLAARRAA